MNKTTFTLSRALNISAGALGLLAVTVPMFAPSLAADAQWSSRLIVLASISVLAYALTGTKVPYAGAAANILGASLVLNAAATVSNTPEMNALPLLVSVLAAILTSISIRFVDMVSPLQIRGLMLAATAAWVYTQLPVNDVAAITLGTLAALAPALSLRAVLSKQRQILWLAIGSWVAVGLAIARVATSAYATHDAQVIARETLGSIPPSRALVPFSSIPEVEQLRISSWLTLSLIAVAGGILFLLATRARKLRRFAVVGLTLASLLGSAGFASAADIEPSTAFTKLLDTSLTKEGGATMLSTQGAGPKEAYRGFTFEQCDVLESRDCFITFFDDIALRDGVKASVDLLVYKTKNNLGANFPAHCHQVIHNLGQMAIEITAGDFNQVSKLGPQVCGTGFTHGSWELMFNRIGTSKMFTDTGTLCSDLGMPNDWFRWTCHHIMGHMIMTASMDNPAKAMEYCSSIKLTVTRNDCLAGGWMNFFQDDYVVDYFRSGKGSPQDLFNICYGAQIGETKVFCYQELFPVIYSITNGDDYLAGKLCLELSEPTAGKGDAWSSLSLNFADRCAQGLARAVAVSGDYDYRRIPQRCNAMPEPMRAPCLSSSAASVVLNTGSQTAGVAVCASIPEDMYRAYCVFWAKNSQRLLAQGPNASTDLPKDGQIRLPGLSSTTADTDGLGTPVPGSPTANPDAGVTSTKKPTTKVTKP